jgi:hypothetical protein
VLRGACLDQVHVVDDLPIGVDLRSRTGHSRRIPSRAERAGGMYLKLACVGVVHFRHKDSAAVVVDRVELGTGREARPYGVSRRCEEAS